MAADAGCLGSVALNRCSESIITAFVVLLALGFAVALFISWEFEMTPEGLKQHRSFA